MRWWQSAVLGGGLGALVGLAIAKLGGSKEPSSPAPAQPAQPPGPGDQPVQPPAPSCPPAGARILLIGDSYALGLGPEMKQLAKECNTAYYFSGSVGSSVVQWDTQSWAGQELDNALPTVVLISLGGNDFGRSDPENVLAHIDGLLHRVKQAGARPLWISPPTTPFPDKIGVRQLWQQRMGSDWFDSTKLDIPRVATDPLGHPTAAGYKLWATAVWLWMSGKLGST